ncbi:MAG: helix-turn-helix transcriptional regulator [Spirochaetaceae bacterium]|nr:helix-turn-helix transcriptional regulator [Spirochaetaceae bacterium]
MGFWHNVQYECDYKGISRKELAAAASFSVHTISNGLKRDGMPAADIALRISQVLEVPLEKLLKPYELKDFVRIDRTVIEEKKSLFNKYYPLIQRLESLPPDATKAIYTIVDKL